MVFAALQEVRLANWYWASGVRVAGAEQPSEVALNNHVIITLALWEDWNDVATLDRIKHVIRGTCSTIDFRACALDVMPYWTPSDVAAYPGVHAEHLEKAAAVLGLDCATSIDKLLPLHPVGAVMQHMTDALQVVWPFEDDVHVSFLYLR